MPVYFNEHVSIRGVYSDYHSGVIGRTYKTEGRSHFEAPIEISAGIMRHEGPRDFEPGLYDGYTIMEDSTYSSYYLAARGTKVKRYTVIGMDLYTVRRTRDLSKRRDAVLIRKEDESRIEVISGGGYYGPRQERSYDNIILRARAGSIIVIQNFRSDKFHIGDQFFRVSGNGVHRAYYGLTSFDEIGEFSEDLSDWIYI